MDINLLHILTCRICYPFNKEEPNLEKVFALKLPRGFNHILCAPNKNASSNYDGLVLRLQCNSNEDAEQWLSAYSKSSGTAWDVMQTEPENLKKYVFKRVYRCTSSSMRKNTQSTQTKNKCSAKITIIVIKPKSQRLHNDQHLPEYPMTIRFNSKHNHELIPTPKHRQRLPSAAGDGAAAVYVSACAQPVPVFDACAQSAPTFDGFNIDSLVFEVLEEINHNESDAVSHNTAHQKLNGAPEKKAQARQKERLQPSATQPRQREVNPQLVGKFQELYRNRHSPESALATHIHDLQTQYRERWPELCEDPFYCPGKTWCIKLYKGMKPDPGSGVVHSLRELFHRHASSPASQPPAAAPHCQLRDLPGGHFAGVIVTPLMRRNQSLNPHAAATNYVSSYVGRSSSVYLVSCHSPAGGCGLPLAALVTSTNSEACLAAALAMYRAAADNRCPAVFMADDSEPLRRALEKTYPEARLLVGLYHVLRATWLYALNKVNGIPETHQVYLYQIALSMVRCPTELDLVYQVKVAQAAEGGSDNFTRYLESLYERRRLWSPCFYDPATREHDMLESSVALMKDVVLNELKGFTTVQLAHFVLSRLDRHHQTRAGELLDGGGAGMRARGMPAKDSDCPISPTKVSHLSSGIYLVESYRGDTEYLVNETVGGCSCAGGRYGGPCEHQHAVGVACREAGAAEVGAVALGAEAAALVREIVEGMAQCGATAQEIVEEGDGMAQEGEEMCRDEGNATEVERFTTEGGYVDAGSAGLVATEVECVTTESGPDATEIDCFPDFQLDLIDPECAGQGPARAATDPELVSTDSGFVLTESGYVTNGSEHMAHGSEFIATELECVTTEIGYGSRADTSAMDCSDPVGQYLGEDRVTQCIANISNSLMENYTDDPGLFEAAIVRFETLFRAKRTKASLAAALKDGNFASTAQDKRAPRAEKDRSNRVAHKKPLSKGGRSAGKVAAFRPTQKQMAMVTQCSVLLHRVDVERELGRLVRKEKRPKIGVSSPNVKKPWITSGLISKKLFIKNHGFALSRKTSVCDGDDVAETST